jgi:uncharacterized membrane protein
MKFLPQVDLLLVMVLSLVCLAIIWLSSLQVYPFMLIPYLLVLILPGYALITVIKPHYGLVARLVIGFLLGLLLFFILVVNAYIKLVSAYGLLISILFLLAILFSMVAILRRRRTEGQLTLDESIKRVKEIKNKTEEEPPEGEKEYDEEKPLHHFPGAPISPKNDVKTIPDKKKTPPVKMKPQRYSTDLIFIVLFTLLTAAFVLIPPLKETFIRTILGVLLVLFIPGYALIAALFPRNDDLDGIERAALSFGLSIAVTPLIGLALNYTPWGIRLDPILISLTVFTLTMVLVAFLRRRRLPQDERFSVPFMESFRGIRASFQGESRTDKILSIILILSVILAITTTAYVIVKPKQGEKFTEFYLLGPNGKASNYPNNLTTGQHGNLTIGVVNHEYATMNYQLVVTVNNTTLKNETIRLQNNAKMEIPFNFTAGPPGQRKLEFLLYKSPNSKNVYRSLHLWLNVTVGRGGI